MSLFKDMITYIEELKKSNPPKKLIFDKSVKSHSFSTGGTKTTGQSHGGGVGDLIPCTKLNQSNLMFDYRSKCKN